MHYGIVPHLYWGIYHPTLKQELTRRYGKTQADLVLRASHSYYRQTIASIKSPEQGPMFDYALLRASLLAAIYLGSKVLGKDFTPSPAEIAALFADATRNNAFMRSRAPRMRRFFTPEGQATVEHSALRSNMRSPIPAYGWAYTYMAGDGHDDFCLTVRRCGILRLYQEMGIPELMYAVCRFPNIWGELGGIKVKQSMCLGTGDPACRFHFTMLPKPEDEPTDEHEDKQKDINKQPFFALFVNWAKSLALKPKAKPEDAAASEPDADKSSDRESKSGDTDKAGDNAAESTDTVRSEEQPQTSDGNKTSEEQSDTSGTAESKSDATETDTQDTEAAVSEFTEDSETSDKTEGTSDSEDAEPEENDNAPAGADESADQESEDESKEASDTSDTETAPSPETQEEDAEQDNQETEHDD